MDQVTLSENVQAQKKLFHSCEGLTGHQTAQSFCVASDWLPVSYHTRIKSS